MQCSQKWRNMCAFGGFENELSRTILLFDSHEKYESMQWSVLGPYPIKLKRCMIVDYVK